MKCKFADKCGGCAYSALDYEEQLKKKQKKMADLFGDVKITIEPIIGATQPYHYRNKVHGVLFTNKERKVFSGIYEEKSHRPVAVDSCLIENEQADAIIRDTVNLIQKFGYSIYSERSGRGLLRHIMVRVGEETGEYLLILVATSPILPYKNDFVKAVRKVHPEITSIVLNINDRDTTMVLGTRDISLYGPGFIKDRLMGLTFRLSPQSFYQINHAQTERLYAKAMEYAHLTGKETVIDAYSGVGTIAMTAAKTAGKVIGVELNGDAVKDASLGAKANGLTNVRFIKADAGEFMERLAAAPKEEREKIDVVFMDPPRSGSTEQFLDAVIHLNPDRIVYISCGPDTQKRDIKYLMKKSGYRPVKLCPVDLFPLTEHVETVVLIQRKDM